jgi:competence protein ComEC
MAGGQAPKDDSLRITFLDVGQGDATLIRTPDGKNVLIDAGPSGERVLAHLAALKVKVLDLVIASHNHADHIGGMAAVFDSLQVREYMDNGLPTLTNAYRRTVDAVEREPGLKVRPAINRKIGAGAAILEILEPPRARGAGTQNDNSVGVLLHYGGFRTVFTGDAEVAELRLWMALYDFRSASVVKASHHGSVNGASADWMAMLRPRIVVISVGANNQYGHPSTEVMLGWSATGARVYRTDAMGSITVAAVKNGGFSLTTSSGVMPWVVK